MTIKTAQSTSPESIEALIDSLLSASSKQATDINPPTEGPGAGKPDSEEIPTEGARSAENDAFIREHLGQRGAESTISPDTHVGMPNMASAAAPKLPTGDDPESGEHCMGSPKGLDPGTSLAGATLGEKEASLKDQIGQWRKTSAELVMELVGEGQAPAAKPAAVVPKTAAASELDAMMKNAAEEKLAAVHMEGRQIARLTLACLEDLNKHAMDPAMMAEMGGGGADPMMAAGPEGGGAMAAPPMDPAMAAGPEGGGGGGDMASDPAMIEQVLTELAAEMGISPEELMALLEEAAAGQGGDGGGDMGGGDMGGEPAAAAPPAEEAPAEEAAPPAEEEGKYASLRRPSRIKVAAAKAIIKKNARAALHELVNRGQRR